jgi:prophage regulatory protein
MQDTFLKIDEVMEMTKLSQSSIYRLEQQGHFPQRVKLSERAVAWKAAEIRSWMDSRESKTLQSEGGAK